MVSASNIRTKSERRLPQPEGEQRTLGEAFTVIPDQPEPNKKTAVAAHVRESKQKPSDGADESALFFDEQKVPVQVVAVANPEVDGLDPADYEVIGEKVSHRLVQRPGSYVILKYVRPVIKRLDTQAIGYPDYFLPGGTSERGGWQPCRCQFYCRHDRRQIFLSPAVIPTAH